ncbi:hypothetical protein HY994_03405 [Candidatus Micrarchaeota archaeon]|nr:hypothetical protein [Candidatus Micrarchaeota archaeon]
MRNELADRVMLHQDQVCITSKGISGQVGLIHDSKLFEAVAELGFNASKAQRMSGKMDEPIQVELSVNRSKRTGRRHLFVKVQDSGPGISPERARALMTNCSRRYRGLEGVRQIAQIHQGKMGVRSELGHGATFWLRIPLRPKLP